MPFEFLLAVSVEHSVRHWLFRLGGVGLIVLGLADNSVVPLPGSMDAFTILLASARREYWWYYAIMATVGAVLGGYITYRLAAKGGKEALEKRIGKNRAEKVYKKFDQGGFLTVLVGAMLPPPFPIVPVLLTAGALQYPRRNFLTALALGRGARFFIEAWLWPNIRHAHPWVLPPVLQASTLWSDRTRRSWRRRCSDLLQALAKDASAQAVEVTHRPAEGRLSTASR